MNKEAMKLALEALELNDAPLNNETVVLWEQKIDEAIIALREALAEQPAQQEPTVSKAAYNRLRDDYNDLVKKSEQDAKYAKEWRAHVNRCQLLGVDLDYQTTTPQPAPVQQDPVAFDVTLEGQEAQALHDLLGDDRDDLSPLRLVVGDGHSGYGLYIALAEYQDEGAELIASITPPAQPQQEPVAVRLWDSQWVNVVNHDNCYRDWSKEDAINHAVKMTEKYIAGNVANNKLPPAQRTPAEVLDWLADQHRAQCGENRPIQEWIRKMKEALP